MSNDANTDTLPGLPLDHPDAQHTLACGVAVGDTIETPGGPPAVVCGMTTKGLEVRSADDPGARVRFIPFAGNTDLRVLRTPEDDAQDQQARKAAREL